MKFALITQSANDGSKLLRGSSLTYHMALAQYILSDEAYRQIYHDLHYEDHFIMLDNGAAENGHSIGIDNVCEAAEMIGADEIVMPDVLDECKATIAATYNALAYVPVRRRAVCPQGHSWAEWERCALELVSFGCRTICIAKRYEAFPGGRVHALKLLMTHNWHKTHDVHLLGCKSRPLFEISKALKTAPWIRGIDTAAPIAYAQNNAPIENPHWYSFRWNEPFQCSVADHNVHAIQEVCRCT